METLNNMLLAVPKLATDDYVGFTFFVGCMAMMAASAFFFLSMSSFDNKWKTSILVHQDLLLSSQQYITITCVITGQLMLSHQHF